MEAGNVMLEIRVSMTSIDTGIDNVKRAAGQLLFAA